MITKTFSKELTELVRDGRSQIALAIILLLLGVAVWVSARQYENINEQYTVAKSTERKIWDDQGEKNPHSAAHYGTYAFKPKYPLSLIDQGVDKYVGTSIFLEGHKRNEAQFSAAADQTGLARFGNLTPDFILLFIIPLLIILLGYNSFTKEKEMGILNLLKSQGVVFWKRALGKWLAIYLPIFMITIVLFLIAGLVLTNLQDFGVFDWNALLWMFMVYSVYYMVFLNLVLCTSAASKKSGIALVLCLAIWITTCLAIPKVASNIAEKTHAYPTYQEFASLVLKDKKEGLDGHNPWNKEAKFLEQNVLKEYGVDSLHQLPFNFDAYRMQKGEEHEAEIYNKHYNHLRKQYINQSRIYKAMAVLSPYLPTRFTSMAIAHTDYTTHWDFADAAETYRISTQKFLNDNFAQNSSYGEWSYQADADFWKELPPFSYDPPELKQVLFRNGTNLTTLGIWLLGSFSLLLFISKRF